MTVSGFGVVRDVTRGQFFGVDFVVALGKTLEQVCAVHVGEGDTSDEVIAVAEDAIGTRADRFDLDAEYAGFASVLDTVAVEIVPHEVANAGEFLNTEVGVHVVLGRGERDRNRVSGGSRCSRWDRRPDLIVAGWQIRNQIGTGGVGDVGASDNIVCNSVEVAVEAWPDCLDRDAGEAGLATIEGAVAIIVGPYKVADGGGHHLNTHGHVVAVIVRVRIEQVTRW